MALNTSWSNRLIADLQRDFGLTKEAAQGLAGALAMESMGFTTMQEISPLVPGSKGGYGMAQWTGPRRKAFERHAADLGLSVDSYEAQYSYLKAELNGVGGHDKGVIRKLRDVSDPRQAQRIVTDVFLRPSADHVNYAARDQWTDQVVSGYVKLPPSDIPTVATQLDTQRSKYDKNMSLAERVNMTLDDTAVPVPAPRSQANAARTNKMLDVLSVPMPKERPERNPTEPKAAASLPQAGTYEYAPNGQPRDPDTGFLMDQRDPRYKEAMGIPEPVKQAPTPAPYDQRPKARLPELAPPNVSKKIPQSKIERNPRTPQPGQSQIERNPGRDEVVEMILSSPRLTPDQERQRGISQLERTSGPTKAPSYQTNQGAKLPLLDEDSILRDARDARDEILLSEARKLEERQRTPGQSTIERNPAAKPAPGQSQIERNKPKSQPGQSLIERSRPSIASRVNSVLDSLPATLPSGSRPDTTKFPKHPGKEADNLTLPPPVLTVNPKIVSGDPAKKKPDSRIEGTKDRKSTLQLPELPVTPLPSINTTKETMKPIGTKKTKEPEGIFESLGKALTDLFNFDGGNGSAGSMNPFKDMGKALSYEKQPLTSKVQAYVDRGQSPSQAYDSANRAATERAIAGAKNPEQARRLNERS